MDAEERRRTEEAMARISRMKRAVEADPAAAVQGSLDASMSKVKRRLVAVLVGMFLIAAVASAFYGFR